METLGGQYQSFCIKEAPQFHRHPHQVSAAVNRSQDGDRDHERYCQRIPDPSDLDLFFGEPMAEL